MMFRQIFLFLMIPFVAQAQELFEMGRSIRSAGMGGMYIPVASGVDALFYNPAALGKGTGLNIELVNLEVGINGQEALDLANTGSSITNPSDYNQFFGKKIWMETTGHAGVTLPYMGIGFLSETHVAMELHNPGFPQFQTYFHNDNVIALGGALSLGNKSYLGMTLKQVQRWGADTIDLGLTTIANANSLSSIGDNFQNKGRGYGIDLAIMKDFDGPTNPTVALTLQDVGNTSFVKTDGASAPPAINQNLSFGAGGSVDLPGLDWVYGFEMRHLLEPDIQIGKKVHIGTEISLPMIDLRAGIGQGYTSYGVGMNFLIFRLDAASYTEELGVYPGQTGQNRILVGLSIDLSFDANFNFVDNNGKRRKLKQRR
jgi:hypothetical protein